MSGKTSYLAGLVAEDSVAALYAGRGHAIAARRWRGTRGEIDLIARDGDGVVFIEVKKARDFARAAERLTSAQIKRIYTAASEFLCHEPRGQDTEVRFDVALVNGAGQARIIENAIGF